jgi:SAM-dependent methyltransferase
MSSRGRKVMMKLTDRAVEKITAQFGRPRGLWGGMVGWIMALRSSNRRRNVWAVSLLDVGSRDRVLEIGFGPGIAIREISRIATEGYVCGVDHSERMLRQASRRNAAAIAAGRVDLRLASVDELPAFGVAFDRILAVNTVLFWHRPVRSFAELRRLLRPGGRIAVAHQPRGRGATGATASAKGDEIAADLKGAGFIDVRVRRLDLRPPVVCVTAVAPAATRCGSEGGPHARR